MSCIGLGRTTQGCGGDCEKTWKEKFDQIIIYKHHGPYKEGFKFCKGCGISIQTSLVRCECCHQIMRTRKRS